MPHPPLSSGPPPLRLGTTTTVEQSGALALLDSLWHGAPIAKVIGPSGSILRSAAAGDLDLVITHAPPLEAKWLGSGRAALRCPFVSSRFAIVGPPGDPAGVARAGTAAMAMGRIARSGARFVSRGDSSGTHVKELALWALAGIPHPPPPRYIESGAGQAAALAIADERGAYALADLPTFARLSGLGLRVLFTRDSALANPYTLYVIRRPVPHLASRAFVTWAMDVWRAHLAALRLPDGTPAFVARPGGCAPWTRSQTPGLVGLWEFMRAPTTRAAAPPARLSAGLQFSLEIDSAAGNVFSGQVRRWFAGDVGVRASNFGRVTGRITGERVSVVIPFRSAAAQPLELEATLAGDDTLVITRATRGTEAGPPALTGGRLVRTRRGAATSRPAGSSR